MEMNTTIEEFSSSEVLFGLNFFWRTQLSNSKYFNILMSNISKLTKTIMFWRHAQLVLFFNINYPLQNQSINTKTYPIV